MVVSVNTADGINLTVPSIGFASSVSLRHMYRMIDRQMQRINLCTTVRIQMLIGIVTAGGINLAVPCVSLTSGVSLGHMNRMIDRQMQRIHLRTTIRIQVLVGIVTAGGISLFIPCVSHTSGVSLGHMNRMIDRQMQRIYLRATIRIQMLVCVITTGGIDLSIPRVSLTSGICLGNMHRMIDRQMQRIHLSAAVRIQMLVCVVTAGGICLAVPCVRLTRSVGLSNMHRMIDRQVQRIYLCTAVGIQMRVGVITAGSIDLSVPSISLASGISFGNMYWIMNRQMQRINLRTTVGIQMLVGVVTTDGVSLAVPCVSLTSRVGLCHMHGVMDGQMQRINLQTTIYIKNAVDIIATDSIFLAIPDKLFACSVRNGGIHWRIQHHNAVNAAETILAIVAGRNNLPNFKLVSLVLSGAKGKQAQRCHRSAMTCKRNVLHIENKQPQSGVVLFEGAYHVTGSASLKAYIVRSQREVLVWINYIHLQGGNSRIVVKHQPDINCVRRGYVFASQVEVVRLKTFRHQTYTLQFVTRVIGVKQKFGGVNALRGIGADHLQRVIAIIADFHGQFVCEMPVSLREKGAVNHQRCIAAIINGQFGRNRIRNRTTAQIQTASATQIRTVNVHIARIYRRKHIVSRTVAQHGTYQL